MNKKIEVIIKAYQEGAKEVCAQLKAWKIGSGEARKLEKNARELWHEDAVEQGIPKSEAKKIWKEKIIYEILLASDDPAWDELE